MKRWLVAAILSSAALPAAALVVAGHWRSEDDVARARAVLPDLLVDAPSSEAGLVAGYGPLMDRLRSAPSVEGTGPLLTGAALLGAGDRRALGRLHAPAVDDERLAALAPLVVAGDLSALREDDGAAVLGEGLAALLGVGPGAEVAVLSLSPGPGALGARRRVLHVAALLRSGLAGFDRDAVVVRLAAARELLAPADQVSGIEVRLARSASAASALEAVRPSLPDGELRVRPGVDRDWPGRDAAALHGLGRSLMLTALVAAALALGLGVPYSRDRGLGRYLREATPLALLGLASACLAALVLAAPAFALVARPPGPAVADLGRLALALGVALLAAPALSGRLRGRAAGLALACSVALATVAPAASSVLASLGGRTALAAVDAARAARAILSPSHVDVMALRGAEVAPARLVGLEPRAPEPAKLLRVLTGRAGVAAGLRPGKIRPPAWSPDPALDDLLEELATHGSRIPDRGAGVADRASGERPGAARPGEGPAGVVLGRALARRLGAEPGDGVTLAAAPAALDPAGEVDPPRPRTFRVVGIASFGLRGIDDRLALADLWQVEALGGRAPEGAPRAEPVGLDGAAGAAEPFAEHARRAGVAGALQVLLLALLLGAAARGGRGSGRAAAGLLLWVSIGLAVGLVMGGADAARGALGLGDPLLYQVEPRGRLTPADGLTAWSLLPGLTALAAALVGGAVSGRLGLGADRVEAEGRR